MKLSLLILTSLFTFLNCSKRADNDSSLKAKNENIQENEKNYPELKIINNSSIPIESQEMTAEFIGEVMDIAHFNDEFYFLSGTYNSVNSSSYSFSPILKLYNLDKEEKTNSMNISSKNLSDIHHEFFVEKDSLFFSSWNVNYLDKNDNWKKIDKKIENKVYEDETFIIYSEDFGEWGGMTWIKSKKTNLEFELGGFWAHIFSFNDDLYFANSNSIYKLISIDKLKKAKIPYHKFQKDSGITYQQNYDLTGLERIYFLESNEFDPVINISNSFIYNDELYFLYQLHEKTLIGNLENNQLIPKIEFQNIQLSNPKFNFTINTNKTKSNTFYTENPIHAGLIEMDEKGVRIYSIKNNYKQKIYTEQESFTWVTKQLDYFNQNLNKISIDEITKMEQNMDAIDITDEDGKSNSPLDEFKNYNSRKIFRKKEERAIDIITEYFFHSNSNKIGAVAFTWEMDKSDENVSAFAESDNPNQNLREKPLKLKEYLTKKYGIPTADETQNRSIYTWNISIDKSVQLKLNSKNFSLKIYTR